MNNKPPLIYRKIYDRILDRIKSDSISPRDFRIIIAQFGLCKHDWIPVSNEMKDYGFFSEITRCKIGIVIRNEEE